MKNKKQNAGIPPAPVMPALSAVEGSAVAPSCRLRNASLPKKPNADQIWKHFEDLLVPRLRLTVIERAIYSHLVRHSRLEGCRRLRFSIAWLARDTRLSATPTRHALRRLVVKGALRLVERSKAGHVVEVLLPDQIRAARDPLRLPPPFDVEEADFIRTRALRDAIHRRENGRCFYCLRRLTARVQCLDHVLPRVQLGRNSYRNLVSCCLECNSQKGQRPAEDFLRQLYRERRLTAVELAERLRALDALASGKLPPLLAPAANPLPRKGRPPSAASGHGIQDGLLVGPRTRHR